ncbi:MAG: EamA family transporter [Armatimonadota bacterium]
MPVVPVIMLLVSISLGAAGQICLKYGVSLLGEGASPLAIIKGILTPYVFGGFVLYGLSSLVYLNVLSKLDLSYAYPFVALSFVIVTLLSWYLLDETLPLLRLIGLALILAGVFTVAASYRAEAAQSRAAIQAPTDPGVT